MSDMNRRREEVSRELAAETGDDILMLDWTEDAASRCGGSFLFNAMDGAGRVLLTRLTSTYGACKAEALILELAHRGVRPKVVYVDDECCGAWKTLLETV